MTNKKTRGHGKTEFLKNLPYIQEERAKGRSAADIHRELFDNNKISIQIVLFRRYLRNIEKENGNLSRKPTLSKFNHSKIIQSSKKPFKQEHHIENMDAEFDVNTSSSKQEGGE